MVGQGRVKSERREKLERENHRTTKAQQPDDDQFKTFSEGVILGLDYSPTPSVQRHAALLRDTNSNDLRARLAIQLQHHYGNAYVQRVIEHIQRQKSPSNKIEPSARFEADSTFRQDSGNTLANTDNLATEPDIESSSSVNVSQNMPLRVIALTTRKEKREKREELKPTASEKTVPPKKPEMVITEEEVKAFEAKEKKKVVTWEKWKNNTKDGKTYQKLRGQLEGKDMGYSFIIKVRKDGDWVPIEPEKDEDIRRVGWSIGREGVWHWAMYDTIVSECLRLSKFEDEVPDLSKATTTKVKEKVKGGNKQEAINLILAEIKDSKMPNLDKCDPPTMIYDATIKKAGRCSGQYDPKTNKVIKIKVRIGDKAFSSLPRLYDVMTHEYQHVNQCLTDPKFIAWNPEIAEFDALAFQIYHAYESGVQKKPEHMKKLGTALKSHGWDGMDELERMLNQGVYDECIRLIREALGDETWSP